MKLYSYWRSSSAHRVRIALHLKGIPFEYAEVNLLEGRQWEAEHRARSPMAKVPVLELDDGRLITESIAILEYVEELHPTPSLLPSDRWLRARTRMLASMVASGIQPFQNREVGVYLRKNLQADEKSWTRHWLAQGLLALEQAVNVTAGRFCVGDEPTFADVFLVPQIVAARRFQVDLEPMSTLRRIDAACAELEAFQKADPEVQPDAPRTP